MTLHLNSDSFHDRIADRHTNRTSALDIEFGRLRSEANGDGESGKRIWGSENMAWQIEGILVALTDLSRMQRLSMYLAQEVLIVLILTAAMLVVVLLLAIGFILFYSGARLGFLWLGAGVWRIAGWGHEQVAGRESKAALPPRCR